MSQKDEMSKRIGEHEYTVQMLPPLKSHDLLVSVTKMIGPSVGPLLDMLVSQAKPGSAIMDQVVSPDFFGKAASVLFQELDNVVLHQLIDAMKEKTLVDGKPLKDIFDFHFLGKLDQMYLWLAHCMDVQWGKLLSALISEAVSKLVEQGAETLNKG